MEADNLSSNKEFLLVGFSDHPTLKFPLFATFLWIYLTTLMGNLIIMSTIYSNSKLHTPMYFFVTHLSFVDISFTSVIFPPMLAHFFQKGIQISLSKCLLQVYFFMYIAFTEVILLAVMAYDRYVAICLPLRYITIMNRTVCILLASATWFVSSMLPVTHIILLSQLSFCESHTINHFFCEFVALMKISCSDTHKIETLTFFIGALVSVMAFLFIIISYCNIALTIWKMKSMGTRHKTFSTCASHLTVVILFYVSSFCAYMRPTSAYSLQENKILSLAYTAVTPLCNPIIYTLKNTEFKLALAKKIKCKK